MIAAKPTPATPSSEVAALRAAWTRITDIRKGGAAVREKGVAYLPKYPAETDNEYQERKAVTPWRPEFSDALSALVAKPFARDVTVEGATDSRLKVLIEDADLRGNNITQFSRSVFEDGVAFGLSAVLVDYRPASGPTVADERASGSRPYFKHIDPLSIVAAYFQIIDGVTRCIHLRLSETVVTRDGWGELKSERIRVMEPGVSTIYEKNAQGEWVEISSETFTLAYVPLVLFITGEHRGNISVRPPLLDLADAQIELYRALSRQEEILTYAGSPMLAANGFARPDDGSAMAIGPRTVLFAPPSDGGATSWSFVQPDASNIKEVRSHIESIIADMRRLGMQPMVQKAGGVSATASAIENARAHSVLQAWAMSLKDVIEQAFVVAGDYIGIESAVQADVYTDFSVEPFAQAPLSALDAARKRMDISRRTYWDGLRRFDVLPGDFDPDEEDEALATETAALEPDDPVTDETVI